MTPLGNEPLTPAREDPEDILLDFYQGADGPTIRVDIQERTTLSRLRDLFSDLAQSRLETVDLVKLDVVQSAGIDQVLLLRTPESKEPEKTLYRMDDRDQLIRFSWSRTPSGWEECAELIDGLLQSEGPAHQYLTAVPPDDALMEVSFME